MHNVTTQKTYMGKTAGGWLKEVKVEEMSAGNFEMYHPVFGVVVLSIDGEMIFDVIKSGEEHETRICLETSNRAYNKMVKMEKEIEERYKKLGLN